MICRVRTLLQIVAPIGALLVLLACGCGGEIDGDDVCRQAVDKHSTCVDEVDPFAAKLTIEGPCNDEVQFSGKLVPFRSWAGVYLACKLPPLTCTCPGQTWITDL
jgi:hypothetical protein